MRSLLLLYVTVILAISSASSFRNHFDSSDDNDDLIHPPWWFPRSTPVPGNGPGSGRGGFRGLNNGGGWHSWGRPTTKRPRVTYPIYQPSTFSPITQRTPDPNPTTSINGPNITIESCKAACLVTNEHNPVCGTDNITYGNIGKLECARVCGVNVTMKRKSRCSTPNPPSSQPSPTPDLSTASPGIGNNSRQSIEDCKRNCPVTSEYNPVCGSDNVTYANPGRLQCARDCGADVQVSRKTSCSVPVAVDAVAACIQTCSVTSEYNPVCGTDNVTYPNPGRMECERNCGKNVQIMRNSPCSVPPGPNNPNLRGPTERPNWNGNGNGNGGTNLIGNKDGNGNGGSNWNGNETTPSMTEVIACMQLCPTTQELNPVCGTNGVTYSNPGKLLCTQFCGVNVRVQKFATCLGEPIPNPHPLVCPTPPAPSEEPTSPPTTQDCINKCNTSPEFKPVCGTDGMTYINLQSLQCQMRCGVDVSVQKLSACGDTSTERPTPQTPPVWINTDRTNETVITNPTPPITPQTCYNNCAPSQTYRPVCGTNGETYASIQRLQCAKRCGINVDVKSMSACNNNPYVDGNKDDTTEENDLGFTIPADILNSIFPGSNPPITKPSTVADSGENYDIDQRFGENK